MFDSLSDRLTQTFRTLTGRGRLTNDNIESGLRDVRLALLEADVNYSVVKSFVENIREKCVGQNVLKGLNPAEQVIKIVHDELVSILGGETCELSLKGTQPASIMLVGLQGSGKTTSAGKLANYLRKKKMRPYLVPLDVYRPAAIDQLVSLAKQLNMPFYPSSTDMTPLEIAKEALKKAQEEQATVLILDTAGRLHVDEALMNELADLKTAFKPQEILFVADAMTGQEAVTVAQSFHEKITLSGVVLTKMDGDARGGAALSIRSVIGVPVKFVGLGEKLSELEVFHPDRIAGRILGMGDVLTLVEKAQSAFNEEEANALAEKMQKASFNFEDYLAQMKKMKKIGSFESILKLLPGMGGLAAKLKEASNFVPEDEMKRAEAIINSMTRTERQNPQIINASRKTRIAKGAGATTQEINRFLQSFEYARQMMKGFMNGKQPNMNQLPKMMRGVNLGEMAKLAKGGNPLQGLFPQFPENAAASGNADTAQADPKKKRKKDSRKKRPKK